MKIYYISILYLVLSLITSAKYQNSTVSRFTVVMCVVQLLLFAVCRYLGLKNKQKQIIKNHIFDRYCQTCKISKPPRVYHCSQCKMCRFRMDHHCNIIGVCIYILNTKAYVQLLSVNFLNSIMNMLYIVSHSKQILKGSKQSFVGAIFGICYCWRAWDSYRLLQNQYEAIKTNQTLVETLKYKTGQKQSFTNTFMQLFGDSIIQWINPIQLNFNSEITQQNYPQVLNQTEEKIT